MDGHCQITSFSGSIQTKGLLACSRALTGQGLLFCFCVFKASLFHTRWQSSYFCLRIELVNDSSPYCSSSGGKEVSVLFQPVVNFCQDTLSHFCSVQTAAAFLFYMFFLFFLFWTASFVWT